MNNPREEIGKTSKKLDDVGRSLGVGLDLEQSHADGTKLDTVNFQ